MQADYITLHHHHQQKNHNTNNYNHQKQFNSPQRVSSARSARQVSNKSDRLFDNKMRSSDNNIKEDMTSDNQDVTKHKKLKAKKSKESKSSNSKTTTTHERYNHHTVDSNDIIPLRVYNTNGEYFDTEMDSLTPLRVLQLAIEDYFKVKVSLQLLMHNRQQINPNYGLAANQCKLLKGDPFVKLVFTIKRGPLLNLICHIHKYNNAYIPLACDEMSLIYELKGQLCEELNRLHANTSSAKRQKQKKTHKWSARRVRLFWRYNELNDRASIHSYGVPTNSVIQVQPKSSSSVHNTERSASSSSYMVEASQTIRPLTNRYKEPFAPQPLTYNMQDYMARQEAAHKTKAQVKSTKVTNSKLTIKKKSNSNKNNNSDNIIYEDDDNIYDEAVDNKYQMMNGRAIIPLHEDYRPNTPHHIFDENAKKYSKNNQNDEMLREDEYYRHTFNYNTDSSSSASEDEWTLNQTAPNKAQAAPLFPQKEQRHLQEQHEQDEEHYQSAHKTHMPEKRSQEPIIVVPPTNTQIAAAAAAIMPQSTTHYFPYRNADVNNFTNNSSTIANMEMLNETIRLLQTELNALRTERQQIAHLSTTNPIYSYSPPQHSSSVRTHNVVLPSKEHELFIKASERISQLERAVDHLHNYLQRAIHLIYM